MAAMRITELERENLEAHVDLCAERYTHLETRLIMIEDKFEKLNTTIDQSHQHTVKVIIGASATLVAAIASTVVAILTKS